MVRTDRKRYILRLLEKQSSVSVGELSASFGVSEVTIRKLLDKMEKEGMIRRTWGGAVSAFGSAGETSYEEKTGRNHAEKQAIAELAYGHISDGDAVYLDSGTTTLELAQLLANGEKRRVIVCTNALNIAFAFRSATDMKVVCIGGAFHHEMMSCSGGMARDAIERLFFDKGFFSGSHFSVERGLTTPNIEEADIKRAAMHVAKECFTLVDYSKYGNDSLALVASCEEMGVLLTDWRMPEEIFSLFKKKNVAVIRAESGEKVL